MSTLLNQVSSGNTSVAYQTYTLLHGIEAIKVLVPLANANAFEEQVAQLKIKRRPDIISLVEQAGGRIR